MRNQSHRSVLKPRVRRFSTYSIMGLTAFGLLGLAGESQAQTLIDDFQGYGTGLVRDDVTSGVWNVVDSGAEEERISIIDESNGNQFLSYGGGGAFNGVYRSLGGQALADGNTGTYFMQFRANTSNPDHSFGLTDDPEPGWFSEFRAQAAVLSQSGNEQVRLGFRSGGSIVDVANDLDVGAWYNLWMVIDNDTNSLDVYFSDGLNDGTLVGTDLSFRDGASAGALDTLLFFAGGDALGVSIDNIYFSEGVSTVNPIPEPSTYAAIIGALAFLGVLYVRRRRES